MLHAQHLRADWHIPRRVHIFQIAANHVVNDPRRIVFVVFKCGNVFAVAQNRHAIGQLQNFRELMGYENDARALFLQLSDDVEQLAHVLTAQGCRRFVQNQHLRIRRQRARNHQHLLLPDRQLAHIRARIQRDVIILEEFLRRFAHRAEIDERRIACDALDLLKAQVGHINVLRHRARLQHVDFLRNIADAHSHRVVRACRTNLLPAQLQRARIGAVGINSVQNLQKRGLSRAVFTDQSQYLAGLYVQANSVVRQYARKPFGDLDRFENIVH